MKLTREDVVLIARMMPWRVVLPVAKRVIPLSTLVSVMELPRRFLKRRPLREKRVASLAHRVSGLGARSPANCLERSLLAYRFLSEMGAGPRLALSSPGVLRPLPRPVLRLCAAARLRGSGAALRVCAASPGRVPVLRGAGGSGRGSDHAGRLHPVAPAAVNLSGTFPPHDQGGNAS